MTIKNVINESLQLIKFKYKSSQSHDPNPVCKILDFEYPGQKGQKSYGKRSDLLGWNLNYYKNKKYAIKAIDDIDSFARMMWADKVERYKRMKDFFPEQMNLIRRYNKNNVRKLSKKKKIGWGKTSYDELIRFDKEAY